MSETLEFDSVDEEKLAALQLNLIPGLGPRLQANLLARFETPAEVMSAKGTELLAVDGIGAKLSAAITLHKNLEQARRELKRATDKGVTLLLKGSSGYPDSLAETSDPPAVLYVKGTLEPSDAIGVAIVGSRQCTHYGVTQAAKIAGALARAGVTVISGLARGIDAAAHQGALDAGGRTLAICATGLFKLYPPEHKDLAHAIINQGALISESPLDRGPQKGLFPQRNRIIAGMSLGVIIIEAGRKSGALHTARHAMEQGRDVFAVPGRIDSLCSLGCHDLIRDGAILMRDVEDVFEALGPLITPVRTSESEVVLVPKELNLSDHERSILNLIDTAPTAIDALLASADMEHSRVLSTLTVLEMKRLVRRLPGSFVERTHG